MAKTINTKPCSWWDYEVHGDMENRAFSIAA